MKNPKESHNPLKKELQHPSKFVENKRRLQRRDFILVHQYEEQREQFINEIAMPMQEKRLLTVSPDLGIVFTNYDLIWFKLQELYRFEGGNESLLSEEIEDFGRYLPRGHELVGCCFQDPGAAKEPTELQAVADGLHTLLLTFQGQEVACEPVTGFLHDDHGMFQVYVRWTLTEEQSEALRSSSDAMLKLAEKKPEGGMLAETSIPSRTLEEIVTDL